jgi:hypothetical protein
MSGKMGAIAGGVAGLIGMVGQMISDWAPFMAIMKLLKAIIMILLMPLVPILKPALQLMALWIQTMAKTMQGMADAIDAVIGKPLAAIVDFFKGFLTVAGSLGEWFWAQVSKVGEFIGNALSKAWTWILDNVRLLVYSIVEGLRKGFGAVFDFLETIGSWLWDNVIVPGFSFLSNIGEKLWDVIKKFFSGTIDVVTHVWGWMKEHIFRGVIDAVTQVWSAIKGLFSGSIKVSAVFDWLKSLFGKKEKESKTVGDAIITPRGVVYTDPNDYIIATKNPASLGGGGGSVVNINVSNPVLLDDRAIKDLVRRISVELQTQSRSRVSY